MLTCLGEPATPDLVADLKAILPTVELRYIKDGWWWLLDQVPTEARRQNGERLKRQEYARLTEGRSVRLEVVAAAELQIAGFCLIGRYQFQGPPPRDFLLDQLRQKVAATQAELTRLFEAAAARSEKSAEDVAGETVEQFVEAEGKSLFAITLKGRKHFVQPGA